MQFQQNSSPREKCGTDAALRSSIVKEVKHLEERRFIFTVYKQHYEFGKQLFRSLFLEADKHKLGGDDVILHHYTKAQRHRRLQILLQAAKQYLQNRQKYLYYKE
ncbi:Hypothetical_protein [Hexamita inflata]|uniref:Hypothetical_protein n=1 Tax=Hexamita inflata TaxID=28002 RepID=A0ABP1KLD8_9EUKA